MIKVSLSEYRKIIKNKNPRSGSLHESDKEAALNGAYQKAIQTIRDIQSFIRPLCDTGIVESRFVFTGTTNSDYDNLVKGVHDAMQGIVYKNDKQVRNTKNEYRS